MTDPISAAPTIELVTQGGLVAVLVWIARELGAIRQAVSGKFCQFVHETREPSD